MNKKQLQTNQTKRRIIEASKELFIQKGYSATSIEDISRATGNSKGNIYYHFKSKEGLFLEILKDWQLESEHEWEQKKFQFHSVTENLYGLAEHMVISELNHPLTSIFNEFYSSESYDKGVLEQLNESLNFQMESAKKIIIEGIESKELINADSSDMAKILSGLLYGLSETCRELNLEETLLLYKKAIDIFLFGTTTLKK
ncbi:TetR/AcrR family transcriptional regulator [Paenibacillus sp. Z3-2]